tara:strand:+ start:699 stop:965 length:267 start_codon:yes stop_codon:yes gene_type:complete
MKIKYLMLLLLISACGGFSEAGKVLRNEKVVTTDEFLIEKRGPLSIPPNVMELPKPKQDNKRQTSNKKNNESKKSSLEKLILEEIKNN